MVSIGFRPFVEACIEADEKAEAIKYIPKLADPRERAEVFCACLNRHNFLFFSLTNNNNSKNCRPS